MGADNERSRSSQTNFVSLPTKLFFTEYRRCIANIRFAGQKHPTLWKDEAEYLATNSSKWRTIFQLIHYLLKSDEEPFPFFDKDRKELVFPEKAPQEGAKCKIVLYLEFTSLLEVLLQACRFEGLEAVCVTGRTASAKRTEAIKQFMTDDNCRLMILSSVGNAGLNLHAAKFMIFMVSRSVVQFISKTNGRCHRIRCGRDRRKNRSLGAFIGNQMSSRSTYTTRVLKAHRIWFWDSFRERRSGCWIPFWTKKRQTPGLRTRMRIKMTTKQRIQRRRSRGKNEPRKRLSSPVARRRKGRRQHPIRGRRQTKRRSQKEITFHHFLHLLLRLLLLLLPLLLLLLLLLRLLSNPDLAPRKDLHQLRS